MGCSCTAGKNSIYDSMNEIIEESKVHNMTTDEFISILKKVLKDKKDFNDKFVFQAEILDVILKSKNFYIQITYLKNSLMNLTEKDSKCLILFTLLFLCRIESMDHLKKNYTELFNITKKEFEAMHSIPNKNSLKFSKNVVEFYTAVVCRYLLDTYSFSQNNQNRELKEMIHEYSNIYCDEVIKVFTDELFAKQVENSFDSLKFLENNFAKLEPNLVRERLREIYIKNESYYRKNKKINVSNPASLKNNASGNNNFPNIVNAGRNNFNNYNTNENFNRLKHPEISSAAAAAKKIEDNLKRPNNLDNENDISNKNNNVVNNFKRNNLPNNNVHNPSPLFKNNFNMDNISVSPILPVKDQRLKNEKLNNNVNPVINFDIDTTPKELNQLNNQRKPETNLVSSSNNVRPNNSIPNKNGDVYDVFNNKPHIPKDLTKPVIPDAPTKKAPNDFKNLIDLESLPIVDELPLNNNTQNGLKLNENFSFDINNLNNNNDNSQEDESTLKRFREQALEYHNRIRELHSASFLAPEKELEKQAQEWAETLASKDKLERKHLNQSKQDFGENIAVFPTEPSGKSICEEFYNDIDDYNFVNHKAVNGNNSTFTQMVWKSTQAVGFGCKRSRSGNYYVVAFYYPRGNINGEYAANVSESI